MRVCVCVCGSRNVGATAALNILQRSAANNRESRRGNLAHAVVAGAESRAERTRAMKTERIGMKHMRSA